MDNNVSYFEFWIILFITITFLSQVMLPFFSWIEVIMRLPYLQIFLSGPLKGTGSQLSEWLLIELLLSNLWFQILSLNNPTHMDLIDLRVYFKV